MKFAAISAEKAQFSVSWLCKQLDVSKSGYYASSVRPPSARSIADAALVEKIKEVRKGPRKVYGSPRMHREVGTKSRPVGRHRVARLMRLHDLSAQPKRRHVKTTDSAHTLPVAENLLARDFTATQPNQKWLGDITYLATDEGWLYLAVVLDLFARKAVGWAMADNMRAELVCSALDMAITTRRPGPGCTAHTDQGSQYASNAYQDKLKDNAMICSMRRKGECWDNALMESFFGTLKQELVYRTQFKTRREAQAAVFEYIEVFYNRSRRHSTLGYLTPSEFETNLASQSVAA